MLRALIVFVGLVAGTLVVPAWAQSLDHPGAAENTDRGRVLLLTSTLQRSFSDAVAERVTQKTGVPFEVKTMLAVPAIREFCAGVGPDYPDIVAVPRRIAKRELAQCLSNNVLDIIEMKVGYDALVVVTKKGDPVFDITPRQVYYGLTAQIPRHIDFVANPYKTWKEIDAKLPALDINVIGPAEGTVILNFMKDIFLEGGCRGLPVFKIYYNAVDRVTQCTTLRTDGRYQEVKAPIALNFLEPMLKAPRGTLAIIPYTVWLQHKDKFDVLPVLGVLPSHQSINDDDYEAVYPVRFYAKRANMSTQLGGNGVAPALYPFIQEIMSEDALGPNGYLEKRGLVIDDPEDRVVNRAAALRLDRYLRN